MPLALELRAPVEGRRSSRRVLVDDVGTRFDCVDVGGREVNEACAELSGSLRQRSGGVDVHRSRTALCIGTLREDLRGRVDNHVGPAGGVERREVWKVGHGERHAVAIDLGG